MVILMILLEMEIPENYLVELLTLPNLLRSWEVGNLLSLTASLVPTERSILPLRKASRSQLNLFTVFRCG